MAGRIRAEDIESVRERTDLVKIVSEYLTLKKAGHDSFVGLCPFHTEKTPSFSVSPSKGVYYCFGCGAGGDAVRFLEAVENLTFPEAVERLAKDAGVTLRYEGESPADKREASRRQTLYRANEEAAKLYHETLKNDGSSEEARNYLTERGMDKETAERFEIGFAPGASDFLLRNLRTKLSPEIMLEAGLVVKDADGTMRDRFRERIVFPVRDLSGRAVGIGARILPSSDSKLAKYLNSPETPVYRKGEMLYNLNGAKGAITRSGEAFVVEGYTDVIALAKGGIEEAVATCGTALSEGHFRLLSRFAQRAVLAFDSDEAGARAAERAFSFHEHFAVQPVVLILPEGADPADFVNARGAEAFRELARGALPLAEYMIKRSVGRFDLSSVEGQTRAVDAAMPVVAGLQDPVRRQEYAHMLAELAGVGDSSVLMKLDQKTAAAGPAPEIATRPKRVSVEERTEREMLKFLARDADTYGVLMGKLSEEHFQSAQNRKLFVLLKDSGGNIRAEVAKGADDRLAQSLSALALEPLDGDATREYAEGVWGKLQELMLQRRSGALRRRLQKMNPTSDPEYDGVFQELIGLDGDLRRLREQVVGD
ncbi:MAG: DNA primase [Actinomycetota bacterium]